MPPKKKDKKETKTEKDGGLSPQEAFEQYKKQSETEKNDLNMQIQHLQSKLKRQFVF